ncbi:hypothetical protein PR002_g15111 [Phytophthora rubi]|uniref:RxLR effector protein n=1 Tax=Phytophthora rubi TaxID=129364 RepID=A0A6A3L014_9STRA|nr:hypothetical protein PR002_g15111 [Phytophthora rubi]
MKTSFALTVLSSIVLALAPVNAEVNGVYQLRTGDDRELKLFDDNVKKIPRQYPGK